VGETIGNKVGDDTGKADGNVVGVDESGFTVGTKVGFGVSGDPVGTRVEV
jgi:hypothetical protein